MKSVYSKIAWVLGLSLFLLFLSQSQIALAQTTSPVSPTQPTVNPTTNQSAAQIPKIDLSISPIEGKEDYSVAIQVLILLTVLSFGPAFITMMTSFTRLIIVFGFLRQALGTQQSPPTQVIVGVALFLTIYIMSPVMTDIQDNAVTPYLEDQITQSEALDRASVPIKRFMLKQTREKDLLLFMDMSGTQQVNSVEDMPLFVVVPAFVISELRVAFEIGFLLFLPFLVIDLVVSSVLLAMGIMFLPPVTVSLPFKILIFVLTDGWYLIVESMMKSFN
jgi:flagellar biosynthetic protein FliP